MDITKQIRMISTDKLSARADFQRPIMPKCVEKIAKNWDEAKMNVITVADINGQLYIINGQHTAAAAKVVNGNKDVKLPCIVEKMTWERAADYIASQQKMSKPLNSVDVFNATVESGDNSAVNISRILKQHGIKLQGRGYSLDSTSAIKDIIYIGERGFAELDDTIQTIKLIWPYDENRYKGAVLRAVYEFNHLYRGEYKQKELVTKLSKFPVEALLNSVKNGVDKDGTVSHRLAKLMVSKYNHGKKANRLCIDKLLDSGSKR